jgi:quercetin dioxygenase-like cupin family protein
MVAAVSVAPRFPSWRDVQDRRAWVKKTRAMIHAFKLYTGADGASHVEEGSVAQHQPAGAVTISFAESPPHSELAWHTAPALQYVITLSGTLEFTTRDGEQFTLRPGDVLVATDNAGTGHQWRLIDGEPWRRVYVVFKQDAADGFEGQRLQQSRQ